MPLAPRDRIKQAGMPLVAPEAPSSRIPLRILFVHSDTADVDRCLQEIRRAHVKVSADVALTPEEFAKRLRLKYYDVVIAEYPARHWKGRQVITTLQQTDRQIPCIFLTRTMQPETVAKLITDGAADCVAMDFVGHLPVAIRRALSESNLREERDQTEKKLRHSEARYRALVGNLSYGMCRCNKKGNFLDVNEALVTMLGYPSSEDLMPATYISDVLSNFYNRTHLLGQSRGHDVSKPLEIEWKRKDGVMLKVRLSGREVGNDDDKDSYEIIVEDVTQQRKLEDHLRQQAAKDSLTGLANYRHLVDTVDAEIKRSDRTAREFALLFLDLDGLKRINDSFGHVVGSQALCRLADVLSICSRNLDTPARFGGDEFALVLPETGIAEANLVAGRICDSLANDGREPELSVSIGVALYPRDGKKVESLLAAADRALYAAKDKAHIRAASAGNKTTDQRHKAAAGGRTDS